MKYPYGLLGIGEDASGKEIRQAYLERLKAYPPEYCGEKFQELNDAYRLLENDLEKAKLNVFGIPQSNPDGGNNVESSCRRRRFGLLSGNGFLAESSEDGSIGMSDSENWKEKLCREFREWLDYLEEEPLPLEEDDSAPDMLTFFCELAALRQEVGLQTRGIRKNSQEMQETLSVLKESLANGSSELKTVLQEVKSQIPQTRSMAEDTVLSELIRTAFVAKPGCRFIVSDFSAIEARVMGYLAGEGWVMEEFRGAGKIYEQTASKMFHIPIEEITKGSPYRARGKVASLACQYGGAEGALISMGALNFVEEEELKGLVQSWRTANPHIVNYWYEIDGAVKAAVKERKMTKVGMVTVYYQSGMLKIALPSGRVLSYVRPRMTVNRFGSESVSYEGIGTNRKWTRIESYGAKFCENIVQATARDVLAEAMLRLEKKEFDIVCHIHDEVVLEVPEGSSSVEEVNEIMAVCPDWCEGLPLKAAGFESPFYKKD